MYRFLLFLLCSVFSLAAADKGDPAEGKKLVAESKCEVCHENKTLGVPGAIYTRKDRKVTDYAKLKSQVSLCTTQLNLALFPEDEESIVSYLNHAWYKFSAPK